MPDQPQPRELVTRPLAADDWPLIEQLFGAKGACGGCWCMWWRVPMGGKTWEAAKGDANRAAFKALVESGRASGVLALAGGTPVGWCAAGPRRDFPRLERSKALARDWSEATWSINCLYVRAGWRGQGMAAALVAAAVEMARDRGATEVEAYPQVVQPGQRPPGAFVWTGVPSVFEAVGFAPLHKPDRGRTLYLRRL